MLQVASPLRVAVAAVNKCFGVCQQYSNVEGHTTPPIYYIQVQSNTNFVPGTSHINIDGGGGNHATLLLSSLRQSTHILTFACSVKPGYIHATYILDCCTAVSTTATYCLYLVTKLPVLSPVCRWTQPGSTAVQQQAGHCCTDCTSWLSFIMLIILRRSSLPADNNICSFVRS